MSVKILHLLGLWSFEERYFCKKLKSLPWYTVKKIWRLYIHLRAENKSNADWGDGGRESCLSVAAKATALQHFRDLTNLGHMFQLQNYCLYIWWSFIKVMLNLKKILSCLYETKIKMTQITKLALSNANIRWRGKKICFSKQYVLFHSQACWLLIVERASVGIMAKQSCLREV